MIEPGADLGELEIDNDVTRLRFRRTLPHPREQVWRALTEDAHLAAWFPSEIRGERAAGAPLTFVFPDGVAGDMDGEMVTFEPPRLMELRWGPDLLRFELAEHGDATELTLIVTLQELGKAARDGAGWHVCLDLLAAELVGSQDRPAAGDRWRSVHGAYVDRMGPAASTIGPPAEWEEVHGAAT